MEHQIKSRKTIYTGKAFNVEQVQLILPDARIALYDLVRHTGAVTIVPVDDLGNILFVRQYRLGAEQDLLELPAGTKPVDETPDDCAMREVREETGMAADELKLLGDFYLAPGYSSEHMFVFLATGLHSAPLAHDDDEFLEVEALPVHQVMDMVRSNRLQDGKSMAALLLALPYLNMTENTRLNDQ